MSSPSKIAKILVQAVAKTGELEEVVFIYSKKFGF